MERRDFLFAGGAALAGGVILGAAGEQDPERCDPADPNCPMPCGPDGCPVNLVRAPQYAYGLDQVQAYTGVVLDLPPELRMKNYSGGSCVHAATETLLRWLGQFEMAEFWRQNYHGGENDSRLISRMEAAGLKYCWSSDPAFFDWCHRTRRGAGVFFKKSHAINWVGKDAQYDYLLDNNDVDYPERMGHYERVEHNEFVRRWNGYGAFAWSFVFDPPAGTPVF